MCAGRHFIYIRDSEKIMKDKKKLILTIILSVVAVIIFVVASLMLKNHFKSDSDGEIQVEIIELDGTTKVEKMIDFNEGDTLDQLITDNFDNVVIENGMLMSIEDYNTPSDWSTFISIYVDNEMSMVGLLDIEFTDGTVISLVITEFIYS